MLHYPRLPAIPFTRGKEFPWLEAVEKAYPVIQQELAACWAPGDGDFFRPSDASRRGGR